METGLRIRRPCRIQLLIFEICKRRRLPLHLFSLSVGMFPAINSSDVSMLHDKIEVRQVSYALFSMKPWTTIGIDSFHASFFQKQWNLWKEIYMQRLREFFSGGALEEGLNKTLLTLIPKVDNPSLIYQFPHISLCNVVYKVLKNHCQSFEKMFAFSHWS